MSLGKSLLTIDVKWGGGGGGPKICHTSYNDETWNSYTLPKKDSKSI